MEIANIFEANELLEQLSELKKKIAEAESERDTFIEIYEDKIERAKKICEEKISADKNEIAFLEENLRRFAADNLPKGRKSIVLPSGTLAFAKKHPKFYFDDKEVNGSNERLIEFCKANAPEYIKQKVIETADWAKLKQQLIIAGNQVILKETGELIDGLTVQEFPDTFTVTTA